MGNRRTSLTPGRDLCESWGIDRFSFFQFNQSTKKTFVSLVLSPELNLGHFDHFFQPGIFCLKNFFCFATRNWTFPEVMSFTWVFQKHIVLISRESTTRNILWRHFQHILSVLFSVWIIGSLVPDHCQNLFWSTPGRHYPDAVTRTPLPGRHYLDATFSPEAFTHVS